MKYTIKNIVSLFFFSLAMRVARFSYEYMSEESQKEIGAVFESGLTPRALDAAYECPKCGTTIEKDGYCNQHGLPAQPRQ